MNRRTGSTRISMFGWTAAAAVIVVAMVMSGCFVGNGGDISLEHAGPLQTENVSVPLSGATHVHAHLEMAAGELNISGVPTPGSDKLCDGTISYNVPDWKPDLSYNVNGGTGSLMVMQPETHHHTGIQGTKYEWDLHFNDNVPIELAVEMGAGESKLDLANLQLRDLNVRVGAGEATVDLTGNWKQDVPVEIQGGVGEVHVKLPRDMAVRVTVNGALGSVNAPDFKRDNGDYVNDAYGKGGPTLDVTINGGIGQVDLQLGSGGSRGIV